MDWADYLRGSEYNAIIKCSHCEKEFKAQISRQVPGFRSPEDLVCPYCGEVLRTSMELEFYSSKLED